MASALAAHPNANPNRGTPPTAPCSRTQVTAPCAPSSNRMRGTLAAMPKPMLAAIPQVSSMATRRAMTFSGPNSGTVNASSGCTASPQMEGSNTVCVVCHCSGSTTT